MSIIKPAISIIIPVYNVEKYLRKCLDSCINQTFKDIEIIVVNDCSPDNSAEIMKEYEQKYPDIVRCIYLDKNIKLGGARNKGVEIARGEYIIFVDSDDYMKPQMCEILYNTLNGEQADIVICGTEETGGGFWKPRNNENYNRESFFENFGKLLQTELLSPPWNKIFIKCLE